jgi:hypothetical protein
MAGDSFTAANISVTYAMSLGANHAGFALSDPEQSYLALTMGRDAYKRAFDRSHESIDVHSRSSAAIPLAPVWSVSDS